MAIYQKYGRPTRKEAEKLFLETSAQHRAVQNLVVHAKTGKTAEGKTVVYLFLNFPVAQSIPYAHKLYGTGPCSHSTDSLSRKSLCCRLLLSRHRANTSLSPRLSG